MALGVKLQVAVSRAELNAILDAVRRAAPGSTLHFKPDATYTAAGVAAAGQELRTRLAHGCNDDLWQELDAVCEARRLTLSAFRTPAHVSIDALVDGVGPPLVDYLGNLLAERMIRFLVSGLYPVLPLLG